MTSGVSSQSLSIPPAESDTLAEVRLKAILGATGAPRCTAASPHSAQQITHLETFFYSIMPLWFYSVTIMPLEHPPLVAAPWQQ